MTKLFATVLTVATLASTGAFAETLSIGNAHAAPVFANASGNAAAIATVGTARTAPVYAPNSGNATLVTALGSASRAPAFAALRELPANVAFAQ